jgi:hypothetical protein
MGLRETLNKKKSVSTGAAVFLIVVAGSILAYTQWPERRPKGDKAFFTVDDGKSWFVDSAYKAAPFDHDGQTAVRAMVYSYDNGHKTFCPVLERYNADTKKKLDAAVDAANRDGKPLSSVTLFSAPETMKEVEVKLPGPGHQWIDVKKLEAAKVLDAVKSPDDSDIDLVIP